jgi:hypothetical protein
MQGRVTKSSALHFILKNKAVGVCFAKSMHIVRRIAKNTSKFNRIIY